MLLFPNRGFPHSSVGKKSAYNAGDRGSIPELGRSPGEGKGYLLQYSGLENSMDSIVHRVAKNWTQLSDFHFQGTPNQDPKRHRISALSVVTSFSILILSI